MSAAGVFASQLAQDELQRHGSSNMRRVVRGLGTWGFVFFALKGVAWLLLPLIALYLA